MTHAIMAALAGASLLLSGGALAQDKPSAEAAPLLAPKPVFVPGLYESESRNSRFQDKPAKGSTCIASADYEAFRRETMAQYEGNPQFMKACRPSDTRDLPDGFAFAMDCKETKIVLTYHFSKDLVRATNQTLIVKRPEYSSEILTLLRRVGECPGQGKPGRGT